MKEGRKPEYLEKTHGDELQKMPHTKAWRFKPQARLEPAQQHWWQARKADVLTVKPCVALYWFVHLGLFIGQQNDWQVQQSLSVSVTVIFIIDSFKQQLLSLSSLSLSAVNLALITTAPFHAFYINCHYYHYNFSLISKLGEMAEQWLKAPKMGNDLWDQLLLQWSTAVQVRSCPVDATKPAIR